MRRDSERLTDIIEAADKISIRIAKGREAFDTNEDIQIVLVHLVQVIGEAVAGEQVRAMRDELASSPDG